MKRLTQFLLIFLLLLPTGQVFAQQEAEAVISAPDLTDFPTVHAYLDLHNADGTFISGLTANSISVVEDGKVLPLTDLNEQRIGVQTTVAINAGPTFLNRNTLGISRFDYLVEYLNQWAERQKETGLDDLSLITNSGIRQVNLKDVLAWQTAFVAYKPDLKTAVPSVDLLGQAVDIAMGFSSRTMMEKAIIYITPLPDVPLGQVLTDVVNRANQAGTHIFVWMITSRATFDDPRAEELRQLAIRTGGQFTAFSGSEQLPPISTMLEPLRSIYKLSYHSTASSSGQHNLAGQVVLSQQIITTLPVPYKVTIQPPTTIYVSPPDQVIRSTTLTKGDQLASLTPRSQPIEVMVDFPDGYKRSLTSSSLMVDGEIVQVNKVAPFERFNWDISSYQKAGRHILQVQVTDELGLTSVSRELAVDVDVVLPAINRWADFLDGGGIYLLLFLIFAAGVGSTFLLIRARELRKTREANTRSANTGVPIHSINKPHQDHQAVSSLGFKYKPAASKGASLVLVTRDLESPAGYDIQLGERKFTIGSDRYLADVVLNIEGVETRHTVIWHDTEGNYYAGNAIPEAVTLVNDVPVPEGGCMLKPDDLITIGPVIYRYHEYPVHSSH